MKTILFTALAVLLVAGVAGAENIGSAMGSMTTAQSTGRGQTSMGGTVGFTDYTTFAGTIAYGVGDHTDMRLRVGVADEEFFDMAFVVGGDMKVQIWDTASATTASSHPFDMALGPFVEWTKWNAEGDGSTASLSVLQMGGQITGSKTYQMDNGTTWTPYGQLNLRWERWNVDFDSALGGGSADDSHLAAGMHAGVAWGVSRAVSLFGELQIDGNDGLFMGLNYKM
jgi:hypothetical protein